MWSQIFRSVQRSFEDKALIFKKADINDLRDKLQSTCDYPRMVTKLKQQAADFICKKYNWDDVVEETMQLYRKSEKVIYEVENMRVLFIK